MLKIDLHMSFFFRMEYAFIIHNKSTRYKMLNSKLLIYNKNQKWKNTIKMINFLKMIVLMIIFIMLIVKKQPKMAYFDQMNITIFCLFVKLMLRKDVLHNYLNKELLIIDEK